MKYNVSITGLELNALIDLQAEADTLVNWIGEALPPLPSQPNTSSERDGLVLYWIAAQRWLLRSSIENESRMLQITRPASAPLDISVVQISDTLRFFAISGPDAGEIISIACSLDHHPDAFPPNGVSYTNVFGLKGLLVRTEDGFEIAVEASFADMLEDYLLRCTAS